MLRLAVEAAEGGKLDMGALMKQAMASPGHCALQEGCAQVRSKAGQGSPFALRRGAGAGRVRNAFKGEGVIGFGLRCDSGDSLGGRCGRGSQGQEPAGGTGEAGDIY
jgi:hypothetical protein